jgi:hypothetical protein
MKLSFPNGNAKLAPNIFTFSLPAGYACPGANLCKSQAVKTDEGMRIKDGPNCQFRCYAAVDELLKPVVRASRWNNFNALKGKSIDEMVELIQANLPHKKWKYMVRLHVSGDYFSQDYFDAWLTVAKLNPQTIFYGYTKSLPFWIKRIKELPTNLRLTASIGGRWDSLIEPHKLRYAKVVFSEAEAKRLKLPLDHDDSHAYSGKGNFGILLHGTQPAGSLAGEAWQRLKEIGKAGYSYPDRKPNFNYVTVAKVTVVGGGNQTGGGAPLPVGGLAWWRNKLMNRAAIAA